MRSNSAGFQVFKESETEPPIFYFAYQWRDWLADTPSSDCDSLPDGVSLRLVVGATEMHGLR
jgi:hypothetical protein